jgi:hypothetical protein
VAVVAPAALASTFVTSIVGALTYAVLAADLGSSDLVDWSKSAGFGLEIMQSVTNR